VKIRLAGLALLIVAALAAHRLYYLVHSLPYDRTGPAHMILAAIAFMSASVGMAMLTLGPGLFRPASKPGERTDSNLRD
jgi:hypothetical protein